jgi:hypothetical protein
MKNLKMFFAVLLTVVTLSHSKPSQAAAGIFAGGAVAIVGLKVIGVGVVGGLVGGVVAAAADSGCTGDCVAGAIPLFLGGLVAAVGLVILDGEQRVEFKSLSAKEANKLGLSAAEKESFNEELDQANTLLEQVASEISESKDANPENAAQIWAEYQNMVNPLTFSAMQKIAIQK